MQRSVGGAAQFPFRRPRHPLKERTMEYESPEIIASYSEEELTAEAAVSMQYGEIILG